jgi:hypothetical protein
MKHSKLSSKAVSNFGLLLQDIRSYLGGNYVFYDECVVAITRAAARNEDASAWFEQMEKVVNGVREVEISHAGVLFLLQELIRGEGELVLAVLSPPWQHCVFMTSSTTSQQHASPTNPSPDHT